MAIMTNKKASQPTQSLDAGKARLAGGVSLVLSLAALVAVGMWLIVHLTGTATSVAMVVCLVVLLVSATVSITASTQLLLRRGQVLEAAKASLLTLILGPIVGTIFGTFIPRRRDSGVSAQQFLLVSWLGLAVAGIVLTLSVVFWRVPTGVAEHMGWSVDKATPLAILAGVLVTSVATAMSVLLTRATAPGTRRRYSSMVVLSIAAALALVVVVNLLGQYESPEGDRKNYVHVSMETLGRYGLGERTKKILRDVKTPIRLTCVYTSTDEAKQTAELRPRVLELLEDMKIYGDKIEVANVTSDSGKAKLLARLRGQIGSQADQHDKLLKTFDKDFPALRSALDAERQKWAKHAPESYLNMWSLPLEIAHIYKTGDEKLGRAAEKVHAGLAGPGLPDYAELTREIKDAAKELKDNLDKTAEVIARVGKIAQAAGNAPERQVVLAAVAACSDAAKKMVANFGQAGAAEPTDPAAVLTRHVELSQNTMNLALAAGKKLDGFAGDDQTELLRQNRFFLVSAGAVGVGLGDYYRLIAQLIGRESAEAQAVAKNAKADYQKKFILQNRTKVAQTGQSIDRAQTAAASVLKKLATVDPASKTDLALAKKDGLFKQTLKTLTDTIEAVGKLPELKDTSLSRDISGENIVIVEAGGKAEVVEFDEVWPLKVRDRFGRGGDSPKKRVFNGDAAIGSKILSMTDKPFALVLLASWGPGKNMPPQMARMIPPSDLPARALGTIRKRLQEANFAVEDWDLNSDMPDPNDHKDRPKLLVVLPPPPAAQKNPFQRNQMPTPKFENIHRQKIIDAINDGIPAIFLTTFSPPRQMSMFMPPMQAPYAYGDYLRGQWGIDVKTDYLVIPAVTDDQVPGRYKVDGQRFSYLPLSAFSDHPIGKPLQAQRVLWANLCPVNRKKDQDGELAPPPPGVEIESILSVPEHWKSTWATRRIQDLLEQFQSVEGSYIWPNYKAGDLRAGFDVAVAATRAEDKDRKITPARLVVLAVGSSLMDGYLNREVAIRDSKGTISLTDPPRANADLMINSAYWLIGRQNLIASGPVQATMKEIPPGTKVLLVVIYCGLLPALVVGIGSLVMLKRRQ